MPEPSSPPEWVKLKLEEKVSFQSLLTPTQIWIIQSSFCCRHDIDVNSFCFIGTQRRTKKVVHSTPEVNEDKKVKATIKKFGMQALQDIDEVNMFKDDNTVIHLKRPQSKYQNLDHFFQLAEHSD
jgi:hypothetical protein